jgi:hypothetical protein
LFLEFKKCFAVFFKKNRFLICRVFLFAECPKKSTWQRTFADEIFAKCSLPSVTLDKAFTECKIAFAECLRHSAKNAIPVVTRGLAVITQHLEPLLETPSDKVSTGRPRWATPLELSAPAKGVNSTQGKPTCPLRLCRQYSSPGCLLCGAWTSSVPCRRHPGATRTCWSPSTNSPSGSRSDP